MAQESTRLLDVEIEGFPSPGYLLAAPLQQDTLLLVDDYGRPLFDTRVGQHTNAQTHDNKYLTYFSANGRNRCFVRCDQFLRPIDTFMVSGAGFADFHEGKVWTDTSFLILGSIQVQMDLSDSTPSWSDNVTVIAGVIQEQTFDGKVVFEWRTLDHISFADATEDVVLTQKFVDHAHINAVWRDSEGNLLVSCRHTDEILKVDRITGEIIWRLGGNASRHRQFTFLNDTLDGFFGFSHQHSVRRTSRGTLLMLDNGNLKPAPQKSRVVEYELDETSHTVRRVWQYELEGPSFIKSMGSAQELPNGNILVGYGNYDGPIVAQEIHREFGVIATYRSIAERAINPYRVEKTTIGMVGLVDTVTSAGTMTFADRDSTTGVSFTIDTVASDVVLSVERHHLAPPDPRFAVSTPDHLFPLRLAIRYLGGDTSWQKLAGTTSIDPSILPRGFLSQHVHWFVRDTVGKGLFRKLDVKIDTATGVIETSTVARGEIIAGLDSLSAPDLLSPLPGEQVAPALCEFRVRLSESIQQCEITVLSEDGTTPIISCRVNADMNGVAVWYCDSLQPGGHYTWQCSEVGSLRIGRPGELRRFSTGALRTERPVPEIRESTMNVQTGETEVRWSADDKDRTIVQWILPIPRDGLGLKFEKANTDTLDAGVYSAGIVVTTPGTSVYWRAASLLNDGSRSWSDTIGFCTGPAAGQGMVPISPSIGQINLPTSGLNLRFTTSLQQSQYEVLLSAGLPVSPISRQTSDQAGVVTFNNLEPYTRYFWRVIGKTTTSDTGALGMFTTGERTLTTSVVAPTEQNTVLRYGNGEVRIEAPFPIAGVQCIDLLGQVVEVTIVYDASQRHRCLVRIPSDAPHVLGIWVSDGLGRSVYRWLFCSN